MAKPPQTSEEKRRHYRIRTGWLIFWSLLVLALILIIGTLGFRYIVKLPWIDAFHNSAFYTAGMGPIATMQTTGQKLYASAFALLAGLLFISLAAYIVVRIAGHEIVNLLSE